MIWRTLSIVIIATMASLFAAGSAEAGIPIPIPCTGDKLLMVAELPGVNDAQGKAINLGYKMSWCGLSGEWIGHTGSDRSYYPLPAELTAALVAETGLRPPGFWSSAWNNPGMFFAEWLWLLILGAVVVALIKNLARYGTLSNPHTAAKLAEAEAAKEQAATGGVALSPAAPATPRTASLAPATARPASSRVMPRNLQPAGGAAVFGKR